MQSYAPDNDHLTVDIQFTHPNGSESPGKCVVMIIGDQRANKVVLAKNARSTDPVGIRIASHRLLAEASFRPFSDFQFCSKADKVHIPDLKLYPQSTGIPTRDRVRRKGGK